MDSKEIPDEAFQALRIMEEVLDGILVAVCLYGSAVMGGLHIDSDVDILVVTDRNLSERTRKELANRLMMISGKRRSAKRPIEVIVINQNNTVPWQYPPKYEFLYGEWLREQFQKGVIPGPAYDSDLAILLAQVRNNSINLTGRRRQKYLNLCRQQTFGKRLKTRCPV